ncbi:MAG TPA: hypothetical protein VHS29_12635, partial [Candidatus Acidoferrales bacterium]|nr:hypothetical protein [Candidatus Acidoferrales bacterium]
ANRQREAALARRLGEALDQLNPRSAKVCPDAEIIAAYAEHALGADELAQCEDHFASCGRCRNILKVLAAASDAPLAENEVAALGQRVSAIRAPVEISMGAANRPRSKAVDWSTRWLAPAFGIAAVLTVWFVMRPPWRALDRSGSPGLIAQAPRQEMPETLPPALQQPQKTAPAPEVPAAKIGTSYSNVEPSTKDSLKPKNEIREISPNANASENLPSEKKESAAGVDGNKAKSLAVPLPSTASPQPMIASRMSPAAPLPQSRAQADSSAPAASAAPQAANQSVIVTEAAPQVETTNGTLSGAIQQQPADLPVNGRNFQALTKLRTPQENLLLLKSVSGVALWRVGLAGAIEHSTDAGKIWIAQISPSKEAWLAGAVVSETVCWIAGRNGAIARTTDGKNWESVSPPSQATAKNAKLPDWTGIAASNARTATITRSDGTRFATTDGGKIWRQQ